MSALLVIGTVILILILVGVVVLIIGDDSAPANKTAWILIITFLPVVGLVLYLLLGINFRNNYFFARRHRYFEDRFNAEATPELRDLLLNDKDLELVREDFRPLVRLLSHTPASVSGDNSYEIITDGHRKYELLLRDIMEAQESIHIEYFKFGNDEGAMEIRDALMKKAREGVKVRFIYENIANIMIPSRYYYDMRSAGVEVARYNERHGGLINFVTSLNYRNHRKIVVIDGRIAFTGGMNINNHYFREWRDTHLRIMGAAAASLQFTFLDNWLTSGGSLDRPLPDYFPMLKEKISPSFEPSEALFHDKLVLCVPDEPLSKYPMLLLSYEWLVSHAKKYIYFQTPYLVPPTELLDSLKIAALSGVDVRIMVPKVVDTPLLGAANRAYFQECIESGIRIFEKGGQFIHAKTILCDDYLTEIGTANLDYRSFNTNSEVNTYLFDEQTALYYKKIFMKDLESCTEVTTESWTQRKWYSKYPERIMRLFAPLL